jgi:hypothetical protein
MIGRCRFYVFGIAVPWEFISQIFCYPNSSSQDEAIAGRVRVEQINAVKRYLTWMMVANVCNALVLVAPLWTSTLHPLAAAWAAAVIILCFYFAIRQRRTAGARPTYVSTRAVTRAIINSLCFVGSRSQTNAGKWAAVITLKIVTTRSTSAACLPRFATPFYVDAAIRKLCIRSQDIRMTRRGSCCALSTSSVMGTVPIAGACIGFGF